MDIKALEQQDTAEHVLLTPSGDRTDVVFILAGPTHAIRLALEKRNTARGLREFNKKGRAQLPEDADELIEQQVDRLVAYTLGWTNLEMEGAAYAFTAENARKLYANNRYGWLRDQIDEALRTAENFIKPQSLTS